jgi:hypothetical protein
VTWKATTALVIIAVIVGLIVYDLVAYARGGNPATISRMFLSIGEKSLAFVIAVVFALGVLVGHLFLPQHPKKDEEDQEPEQPEAKT